MGPIVKPAGPEWASVVRLFEAVAAESESPRDELADWEQEIDGSPMWFWVSQHCLTRWATLRARLDGYEHDSAAVVDYLVSEAVERGQPQVEAKGATVVYRFPDGTWLAFEQAGAYSTGLGGTHRPGQYRQVLTLEDPDRIEGPSDPKAPEWIQELPAEKAQGLVDGWNKLGEVQEPESKGPATDMLTAYCHACDSHRILPASSWPLTDDRTCPDCGSDDYGAKPCAAIPGMGTVATADDVQGPGQTDWPCLDCGHPAVLHAGRCTPAPSDESRGTPRLVYPGLPCVVEECVCVGYTCANDAPEGAPLMTAEQGSEVLQRIEAILDKQECPGFRRDKGQGRAKDPKCKHCHEPRSAHPDAMALLALGEKKDGNP